MKIDTIDGTIRFTGGEIRPEMDRALFLDSASGKSAKERLVNDEWRQYQIEPEVGIVGGILFKDDKIERIFLTMRMPSDSSKRWSVEGELQRKAKHDEWLRMELGSPPYRYSWGNVVSDYDARACASEIIVVYDR
jgi:hypothetical protein